jgi:uncharacterized membrane protein YdjX (TVP38/TMEM64 family)
MIRPGSPETELRLGLVVVGILAVALTSCAPIPTAQEANDARGSVGLITGGLLGYFLTLSSARRILRRFAGVQSLKRMESLFELAGAWAIVLTRSLPYSIPEAMVFLAGLAGMPLAKFTAALAIGSVPTGFVFAAIGAGWADQPALALVVSYVLPILLLPIALYLMRLRPS